MAEKKTNHNILIGLLSESPIPIEKALFALRKSIDDTILEDADLMIVYARELEAGHGTHAKKEREPSKLGSLAARSPGVIGDLFAFVKNYKWYQIYMGFAGIVLIGSLLLKWVIRFIT